LTAGWWLDLVFGFTLGGALMGGIFAVELAAGWASVTGTLKGGWGSPFMVLGPLAVFVGAGVWEELFYRGYILKNLAEGLNSPPWGARGAVVLAWAFVAGLFGVMHLGNPGANALAAVNIAAAGFMLGLPYVLTGELAAPIGLHVGWNLFQNMVFGFPVSGIEPKGATIFSVDQTGPALWTGGTFGPEGSLIGLSAVGVGCAAILGWARLKEGQVSVSEKVAQPPARSDGGTE
jgi:membrane protease YdiL (CAAX protease family)